MNILKKTDRGNSRKNYLADTRPDVPVYDLDKLARKSKALQSAIKTKYTFNLEGVEYEDYQVYKSALMDQFMQTYPPFFTRVQYPLSCLVEEEEEEVRVKWNKDWLMTTYSSDQFWFFKKVLENSIVLWYTNGEKTDKDFEELLNAALNKLKDGYKVK